MRVLANREKLVSSSQLTTLSARGLQLEPSCAVVARGGSRQRTAFDLI